MFVSAVGPPQTTIVIVLSLFKNCRKILLSASVTFNGYFSPFYHHNQGCISAFAKVLISALSQQGIFHYKLRTAYVAELN